ncbi:MAG: AhpC/TSA family protein [Pseudomonadales bacterium]|nr:AhpC/TSA family protein [Pseudomonadales bacterium]
MSLQDMLKLLNTSYCKNLAAQDLAVLQRATVMLQKSGITESCLQVGETVPNFSITMADGQQKNLCELLADGPLVLNFFRGFWCSYCKTELNAFIDHITQINDLGYQYLSLSPQGFCAQSLLDDSIPAPLVKQIKQSYGCDTDNQIAKAFGIAYSVDAAQQKLFSQWKTDLSQINASEDWELPIPATYIIGQQRQILFSFVDVDFRQRFDPEELIQLIESLK